MNLTKQLGSSMLPLNAKLPTEKDDGPSLPRPPAPAGSGAHGPHHPATVSKCVPLSRKTHLLRRPEPPSSSNHHRVVDCGSDALPAKEKRRSCYVHLCSPVASLSTTGFKTSNTGSMYGSNTALSNPGNLVANRKKGQFSAGNGSTCSSVAVGANKAVTRQVTIANTNAQKKSVREQETQTSIHGCIKTNTFYALNSPGE